MSKLAGKRVVVTGGAGFLGKCVVRKMEERGCREIFVPQMQDYDLVRMEAVEKLYADAKPDIVVHLAGKVGGIGANMRNPGSFFYENLMMGVQLMEQGRLHGIEKFVAIGSVCAYPESTPVPFKEDDLWNGYPEKVNAPYGLAKKMLLVQSQAYRQQYGFNAICLLPVNLYGSGDNFDQDDSHVIPALIRRVFDARDRGEQSITAWGTGQASREFLYVEDAAEGIVLATEKYDKPDPVNLGAGFEITIRELAGLICELAGFAGKIEWDTCKPEGEARRCLDTSRAKKEFGFVARTGLREGLQRTIEWYERERMKGSSSALRNT